MTGQRIVDDHRRFRVILQGMSHPGKVYSLPDAPRADAVDLLGCLLDHEVSFAVIDAGEMEGVLVRRTGSRPVSPENAEYILVGKGTSNGRLAEFRRGSLEYPDTGATVVYLVEKLEEGGEGVLLSGPGVKGAVSLRVHGFQVSELRLLQQVNGEFPLGVDVVFLDRYGCIACIPRSSRIGVS